MNNFKATQYVTTQSADTKNIEMPLYRNHRMYSKDLFIECALDKLTYKLH